MFHLLSDTNHRKNMCFLFALQGLLLLNTPADAGFPWEETWPADERVVGRSALSTLVSPHHIQEDFTSLFEHAENVAIRVQPTTNPQPDGEQFEALYTWRDVHNSSLSSPLTCLFNGEGEMSWFYEERPLLEPERQTIAHLSELRIHAVEYIFDHEFAVAALPYALLPFQHIPALRITVADGFAQTLVNIRCLPSIPRWQKISQSQIRRLEMRLSWREGSGQEEAMRAFAEHILYFMPPNLEALSIHCHKNLPKGRQPFQACHFSEEISPWDEELTSFSHYLLPTVRAHFPFLRALTWAPLNLEHALDATPRLITLANRVSFTSLIVQDTGPDKGSGLVEALRDCTLTHLGILGTPAAVLGEITEEEDDEGEADREARFIPAFHMLNASPLGRSLLHLHIHCPLRDALAILALPSLEAIGFPLFALPMKTSPDFRSDIALGLLRNPQLTCFMHTGNAYYADTPVRDEMWRERGLAFVPLFLEYRRAYAPSYALQCAWLQGNLSVDDWEALERKLQTSADDA